MRFTDKSILYIFLFILAIIGLISLEHYGIAWDESYSRKVGLVNYAYLFEGDDFLLKFHDRDYGAIFELGLMFTEKTFHLEDFREVYLMRHFISHLFFLLSSIYLFRLCMLLYNHLGSALIIVGFYLLHPVIYGHSFYNSKDIPFMALFVVTLYYLVNAYTFKSIPNFIKLGLVYGILISTRIIGLVFFPIFIAYLFFDPQIFKRIKENTKLLFALAITLIITVLSTWPYLWHDPLNNFVNAIVNMSKFTRFKADVLVWGELRNSQQIGWDYFFIYFGLTTPLLILALGVLSFINNTYQCITKPSLLITSLDARNKVLFIICFAFPITSIILLKSVLYDSWRHLFFLYPPFILLSGYLIKYLFNKFNTRAIQISMIVLFSFHVLSMFNKFPNHHIYFNQLVSTKPENIRKNFEQDYWGTSFNQALNFLSDYAKEDTIKVHFKPKNGLFNLSLMPKEKRQKFQCVSTLDSADYFVTTYRYHPDDYLEFKDKSIYKLTQRNSTLVEVFKIKE